ncbi:MAG: WecB/TagA/CpsF family glycosyltransferase [Pegethrix bostrychoides GSE-TBD4-15B]|jgi:exopolysaccharide biosynthesis WecB/TagA/CpsF family protein|uniref:WecB/TagA/CpsF family glycosyltransferase n=1 Tax=Pegethrix bostrychoides GSE-TBD4-15B TaxID=2839662 RepID=A0A951P6N1_9CYAN|nr:WecB/TagA/CpsF family glycosyltransferase [Pegethrix bostrychoides GSE-TBD4-15B]
MGSIKLLNTVIDNLSMSELLQQLKRGVVFTPNVDHLVRLQRDREFFETYQGADYRTCDSKILYYVARLLGSPVCEKISGSDLFPAFYWHHRQNADIKIFLLGAAEGVAVEAQQRINNKVGREIIVGAHSPSYGFEKSEAECQKLVELVNQSGANVLAVGVGSPKQEKFIYKYRQQFKQIDIFLAIGATIDFEAGNVSRAPKWVSELGLEWLYRLLSEPKRLWRRYLVDGPAFFWYVLLQLLQRYKNPFTEAELPREFSQSEMVKAEMSKAEQAQVKPVNCDSLLI